MVIKITKKSKGRKSLSDQMSFLEYEIMSNINFLRRKKYKVNMQLIYNQLDDDPKRQISGFTRGMLSKKWLKLTKREGFRLTDEGKRFYNSFKRKWDS